MRCFGGMIMLGKLMKLCISPILKEISGAFVILLICFFLMFLAPFISYKSDEAVLLMILLYIVMVIMISVAIIVMAILHLSSAFIANNVIKKIPGFSKERFEREVEKGPVLKKVYVCSDVIIYVDKYDIIHAIPTDNVIWAYSTYAYNPGEVTLGLKNGKKAIVYIRDKKAMVNKGAGSRYVLRLIARKNIGVEIGYDQSLENRFKNNFNLFLSEASRIQVVDSSVLEQEYIANNYYEKDFC